ncbi:MAG: DUF3810 domain-containing protein [Ruminococcaceae bacterium]|nr:DUF3810 domain-containing protein [Oscillospiraceae bacterium]
MLKKNVKACEESSPPAHSRYEKLPLYFYILLGIAAFSLIVYLIAVISPAFANWLNGGIGAVVRAVLAHLTSWIPFSLAEILLYLLPVGLTALVIYAYRCRCETWRSVFVFLGSVISVFSLFFSVFVFGFGAGYHTDPLDRRLGLAEEVVTEEELYRTAVWLAEEVNLAAADVTFAENGFSVMPYDQKELSRRLVEAYDPVCDRYAFVQRLNSRVKPVIASHLMSYTHITGVYTYFTGEANLNMAFPDYTLPYTAAHELAHQRGIARENEANFVAFLVTVASDDPYIRYSGYLNLFEYVSSALYYENAEQYKEVLGLLDAHVIGELRAFSAFFDTYRDSLAADISGVVNDTHLKLNGSAEGVDSYGLVVDLAVAYHKALPR